MPLLLLLLFFCPLPQGAYDRARTILTRNEGELHTLLTPYAPAAAAAAAPLSFAAGCV
jgi:hypothetical protein